LLYPEKSQKWDKIRIVKSVSMIIKHISLFSKETLNVHIIESSFSEVLFSVHIKKGNQKAIITWLTTTHMVGKHGEVAVKHVKCKISFHSF